MYKFNPDAVMSGFARGANQGPMTMDDVAARQERLKALGLDDGLLGDLNAMAGQMAQYRNQLKGQFQGQAMSSLQNMLGGSEAALGSAAGEAAGSGAMAAGL